jgi:hypothetical protein
MLGSERLHLVWMARLVYGNAQSGAMPDARIIGRPQFPAVSTQAIRSLAYRSAASLSTACGLTPGVPEFDLNLANCVLIAAGRDIAKLTA